MKEIRLSKAKDYQVGNVRVGEITFRKIAVLAKQEKVSNQVIVRAILDNFIDEIKFTS